MPYEITRRFEFDAGHRVLNHEGKCRHLHGHRYRADVTLRAGALDKLGRVLDFGEVKNLLGHWIDSNLDHNMILHPDDPLLNCFPAIGNDLRELGSEKDQLETMFAGKKPYIMPHGINPTAENIAEHLYWVFCSLLQWNDRIVEVSCHKVTLYETPNCWAAYPPL